MTAARRFDLFPRGISEAFAEHEKSAKSNPNLAIEKNALIYYPWPHYFFFNKNDVALQKRIETDIRKMMKDGSFDAIFNYFSRRVTRVRSYRFIRCPFCYPAASRTRHPIC